MQRFTPRQRRFAYALAGLAGYIDVTGFLQLDGYFVSFMTGNTTLLARDLATGAPRLLVPFFLIFGFVLGVTLGTLIGDRAPERRKLRVTTLVLSTILLAATARALGASSLSLAMLVLSMGALNTALTGNRANPVGLTYMTGAMVRTGQLLAERLRGNVTANPLPFVALWGSLLAGAVFGALVATNIAIASLWMAAMGALILTWLAARLQGAPD